jgi:hypothetical protein
LTRTTKAHLQVFIGFSSSLILSLISIFTIDNGEPLLEFLALEDWNQLQVVEKNFGLFSDFSI